MFSFQLSFNLEGQLPLQTLVPDFSQGPAEKTMAEDSWDSFHFFLSVVFLAVSCFIWKQQRQRSRAEGVKAPPPGGRSGSGDCCGLYLRTSTCPKSKTITCLWQKLNANSCVYIQLQKRNLRPGVGAGGGVKVCVSLKVLINKISKISTTCSLQVFPSNGVKAHRPQFCSKLRALAAIGSPLVTWPPLTCQCEHKCFRDTLAMFLSMDQCERPPDESLRTFQNLPEPSSHIAI